MTTLLTKALQKVEKLPSNLQNEIAKQLINDVESEQLWQKTFTQPQPKLDDMANIALHKSKKGMTKMIGIDEL